MIYFLWAWCTAACFISPIWLTIIYLYLSGAAYQYGLDNDGVAGFMGMILLGFWVVLVLVPVVGLLHQRHAAGRRQFWITVVSLAVLILFCLALCRFDVVAYLTTPGGIH